MANSLPCTFRCIDDVLDGSGGTVIEERSCSQRPKICMMGRAGNSIYTKARQMHELIAMDSRPDAPPQTRIDEALFSTDPEVGRGSPRSLKRAILEVATGIGSMAPCSKSILSGILAADAACTIVYVWNAESSSLPDKKPFAIRKPKYCSIHQSQLLNTYGTCLHSNFRYRNSLLVYLWIKKSFGMDLLP